MEQPSQYYPPSAFYFTINIVGQKEEDTASFQEVSGLQTDMSTEQATAGGENQFKYRLPGAVRFQNLVLKRGILDGDSSLSKWVNATLNGDFSNPIETKTIQVSLLDNDGKALMGWKFYNAYPVKWEVSDFESMENRILVESMEFAYSYFEATQNNAA